MYRSVLKLSQYSSVTYFNTYQMMSTMMKTSCPHICPNIQDGLKRVDRVFFIICHVLNTYYVPGTEVDLYI